MQRVVLGLLITASLAAPADAHFGLFGRHSSARAVYAAPVVSAHYYYPAYYYPEPVTILPPACPAIVAPPVVPAEPLAPLPVQPLQPPVPVAPAPVQPPSPVAPAPQPLPPAMQQPSRPLPQPQPQPQPQPPGPAVPEAAPPSERGPVVPPTRPTMPPAHSTSFRAKDAYFTLFTGGDAPGSASDRCAVTFWNLTSGPATVRAGGGTHALARGRSITLQLKRKFAWQIDGRSQEISRAPSDAVTILIRR